MGILDGIVEWIAEQVMAGLDLITTSVLGALGCDMAVFLRYFPAAETMYSVFVALGIGIILLKYAGKVTDVHKGVVYVRLANGVNAVAHSCYDYRMPGKKDDVSFAVTHLDVERGIALGIITRIIRQNL